MTTTLARHGTKPPSAQRVDRVSTARVPLTRLVTVELRKSFDTRSGLGLLAGIAAAAFLTTAAVIAFAPPEQLTYSQFTRAIGFPMSIILPIIAVLSVTAEWSQRSGLTTFSLVPRRTRVLIAKAVSVLLVALATTPLVFAVGAVGNLAGSAIADVPATWDMPAAALAQFALGNALLMLTAFTFGVLIRTSSAAIVTYLVYGFIAPTLLTFLALNQQWFDHLRPWVDARYNQDALMQGLLAGGQWWHLGLTTGCWLVVPLALGTRWLLRSEVK